MIVVHHLSSSRSHRIIWLLEELGVEYEVKRYERMSNMLAPPELKQIHPLGKSPVVTDGDVTVAESGAIVDYLVSTYGSGRLIPPPSAKQDRLKYTYWLHFSEGSAMPPVLMYLVLTKVPDRAPFFIRPVVRYIFGTLLTGFVEPNLARNADYMESELRKTKWFAGDDFTAADVIMSFPVEAMAERGGMGAKHPKLAGYLERIHARPAWKRALETGGEYHLL
ncbi:hypothetical protein ABBQ32_013179 [Trebouxia sp. C0010 RCD-2024]